VLPGDVPPGIAVVHVPDIAGDMRLQDHDVSRSHRRHARPRGRARVTAPVGGEFQLGNDFAEAVQRRLAAAERMRVVAGGNSNCEAARLICASFIRAF
jgi:hypothetical protein